jgi:hypothetical protein
MTWVSPARRAVAYTFRVTSDDDELGRRFDELVAAFPVVDADDDTAEWVVTDATTDDAPRWILRIDGAEHGSNLEPEPLAATMVQTLNSRIVLHWPGVVCHAGGVSLDGRAVVLPADPGSGKSTLTCGLVRAGFSYLTDEGVAFVPGSARIEPYAKPISLDPGSWFLFPEFDPGEPEPIQWHVPPAAIRPDAVSAPCEARFLVFPTYVADADTVLTPMGRAEALLELAKNTFDFKERSREAIDQLEIVVRACACYRLTVGSLDDAIARIRELVDGD